jgi:phytoene dehydrogenase-like protein
MHTIVVGAGIAGLWIAEQLASTDSVTILEKANYIGGRIITSKHGYEIGAGRIAKSHRRILALIKRFKLQTYDHDPASLWKAVGSDVEPNLFVEKWAPFIKLFKSFSAETLATHTLRQLATKTIGPALTDHILYQFGFRAETDVLRADLGIQAFEHEMGHGAFIGIKGGLSTLTQAMASACRKAGVKIQLNTEVSDVSFDNGKYSVLTPKTALVADRVILALPSEALKLLPCMSGFGPLQHLKMEPLTRIYAQFEAPWYLEHRLVTDSPLRFIIPINAATGLVMISYTESQDTERFRGLVGPSLQAALTTELRRLFPGQTVPPMKWARAYEWTHGCTYWTPGNYDPAAESALALRPFRDWPRFHLCNESFSLRQAWMEGSLEHAAAIKR